MTSFTASLRTSVEKFLRVVRLAHYVEISAQLRAALTSRTVIDQSIGIIMGQNGCGTDAAFAVLRSASQNRNVRLRTVAAEIITAVSTTPSAVGHPVQA